MTTFLCDTNILSELVRPRPNAGVESWSQGVSAITVSAITVEEIAFGLAWKPNARILDWFQDFLHGYAEILPVTAEIAERSGHLRGTLKARGRTRTQADMLIAATAQAHGLTLVTRNARDFEDCGLSLLDPFL
jgi:predicted nucleic acid-binding protein